MHVGMSLFASSELLILRKIEQHVSAGLYKKQWLNQ